MLLGWLVLVLLMSVVVARSTDSAAPGNLLAFLFTQAEAPEPLPAVDPTPSPPPEPTPAPASAPAETPQAPEWVPLAQGREAGKGVLGEPRVRLLDGGAVEVRFACTGTPGNFMIYHPDNVPSLSVDLQGRWGKGIGVDRTLKEGCLSRVQIADHAKWIRISGVARDGKLGLSVKVEHSSSSGAIRLVFSAGQ